MNEQVEFLFFVFVLTLEAHTYFFDHRKTLGLFDPTHFLIVYHFTIIQLFHAINLIKFSVIL